MVGVIEEGDLSPVVWIVVFFGWNMVSQTRFFFNYLERLDPDLVVLMPVDNDFDDCYFVNGFGYWEGFVVEFGFLGMGVWDYVKLFMEFYDCCVFLLIKKVHLAVGGRDVIVLVFLVGYVFEF